MYPKSNKFTLLTNDFASFSNAFKTKRELEDLLTELKFSNVSRTFTEVINRIQSIQERNPEIKTEVFLISDFQKSTFGEVDPLLLDSLHTYNFVPVVFPKTSNVFIDSIYLANPFLTINESNELNIQIANSGDESIEDLILKFFVNEQQISSASVDIEPLSKARLKFNLNFELDRLNKCRLSFEEFPVAYDNDVFFNLNLADPVSILEINPTLEETPITKVYGNDALFNLSVFSVENVDYNLISEADLVVLNQLDEFETSLIPVLKNYLSAGGNMVIIPSADPVLSAYQSFIPNLNNRTQARVGLVKPDLRDPFFHNIFLNPDEKFEMPEAQRIFSWPKIGSSILKFPNQTPFLTQFKSRGTINLFGAPLVDEFTNLHKHAIFVPIMYRIAFQSKAISDRLYFNLNETVLSLSLDSLSSRDILKLRNENEEIIPNQRVVQNQVFLELPKFSLNTGFYNLIKDEKIKRILSFNYDKNESELEQYSRNDIQKVLAGMDNVDLFESEKPEDFSKMIKQKYHGIPLWKYCMILALFFLLAEVLLIRFL